LIVSTANAATFVDGGNRLAAVQNTDGGWDWPVTDGNPATGSQLNTLAPIGMGLISAYSHGGTVAQATAISNAGNLLLSKTNNFSPSDGYFAAALDNFYSTTAYSTHVINNYYAPLAAGTYNRNGLGTLYSTASYVGLIRASRTAPYDQLAAWDLGVGLYAAAKVGAPTADWAVGVKAEINELTAGNYYDVLGLGAGVLGLAAANETFDPTSGSYAAASSVNDLAAKLATYQLADGSFTWLDGEMALGNDSLQETTYAILALSEANRAAYLTAIQSAGSFLISTQLPSGGWENYAGAGENNQETGHALWAINTVPEPTGVFAIALAALTLRRTRRRA
jgi:hypothetical protein